MLFVIFRITLTCLCTMDFRKFPMDRQVCELKFSSCKFQEKIPLPMQSNFLVQNTEKAVVVANYHSPDFTYEKISTETVKCGAIVEVCQGTGRFTPFAIRVWLNVNPIFGRILWQRICVSEHFCVNLTSWLFHQWRGIKESNGKGTTQSF